MRRVCRIVEIRLVTVPACRARQAEVVVGVALATLQAVVGAGQRKTCGGMIEGRSGPPSRLMAHGAILRKAAG